MCSHQTTSVNVIWIYIYNHDGRKKKTLDSITIESWSIFSYHVICVDNFQFQSPLALWISVLQNFLASKWARLLQLIFKKCWSIYMGPIVLIWPICAAQFIQNDLLSFAPPLLCWLVGKLIIPYPNFTPRDNRCGHRRSKFLEYEFLLYSFCMNVTAKNTNELSNYTFKSQFTTLFR